MRGKPALPVHVRLFDKVVEGPNGCWIFTGSKSPLGYGRLSVNGAPKQAHRLAYEYLVGEIPEGLELDHLCRNPSCVNAIEHLDPVTHEVNMARTPAALRTTCQEGHPFDSVRRGKRECSVCRRAYGAAYRATHPKPKAEPKPRLPRVPRAECAAGHPRDPETSVRRSRYECRACALESQRVRRTRAKAAA